jgi:hypothetical protein
MEEEKKKEIKLDFTSQDINLILKALGKLPAEESYNLITKILSANETDNN